ncbi:hypothetical protein AGMMS49975_15010 [Clostridia bacterium]|nr:hypothetical protein AGMMS49975_15010 [Clostridia bacterium]
MADILPYLVQEATLCEYLYGTGNSGAKYGESYVIRCRIQPQSRKMTDNKGVEIVASGMIFLPKGTEIPLGSKITYKGKEYKLISLESCFSMEENHVEGWLK